MSVCFCGTEAVRECDAACFGGSLQCGKPVCDGHMTCDWHGAMVRPWVCPECGGTEPEHAGYCSLYDETEGANG